RAALGGRGRKGYRVHPCNCRIWIRPPPGNETFPRAAFELPTAVLNVSTVLQMQPFILHIRVFQALDHTPSLLMVLRNIHIALIIVFYACHRMTDKPQFFAKS